MLACRSDHPTPDANHATAHPGNAVQATRQASTVIRGYALHAHEVRTFQPCDAAEPIWVIGQADGLWALHKQLLPSPVSNRRIFAVVEGRRVAAPGEGFGADYTAGLEIDSVLYAGLEGPDCSKDWNAFDYQVFGNEPFWSVRVADDRMRLMRLGEEAVAWHGVGRSRRDNGVSWVTKGNASGSARLLVMRQACRDSMSGAYYAFSGLLQFNGETLEGCGLQGSQ